MPSIAAFVKLRAKDQTSKVFDKMARRAERMERKTKKSFKGMSRSALGFKSIMGGVFGGNLLTRGTQLLTQGLAGVGREFVDFDQALTVASAKFPEKIKRGTKAFKELQDAARKVGAETQFTAKESAEGLALFAAAGVSAENSIAGLQKVVDLATATSIDFASATQTSLDALGQFGLKSKDAAGFAGNLERVNNSLVFTVNSAKLQMEDLAETLKFVGPVANTAGAEIEEVNAIIAAMSQSGIRGSLAGTALKNMYLRLLDPTPKVRKELKKLNIEIDKDGDGAIQLTGIIEQLEKSMGGMSKKTKAASLSVLFGKRAVAGAAAAMEVGSKKIAEFEDKMKSAGAVSRNTADDIRKGLGNQLKILQSTAIEAGFRLLEDFAGDGETGIQTLTEAIRKFDMKPVADGIRKTIDTVMTLTKWIGRNWDAIKAVATGLLAARGAIAAINGFHAALGAVQLLIASGPYGPLILAIGLVVAAAVKMNAELEKNIALQNKAAAATQLTKNIREATEAQTAANEAMKGLELDTAIRQYSKLTFALDKAKKNQTLMGDSTEDTEMKLKRANDQMTRLINLQRLLTGNFMAADISAPDRALPSVFTGEGLGQPTAPNAAEASAKGGSSSLDVNFNNAPSGTTTKTKQGKGAPTVNANLAGANP